MTDLIVMRLADMHRVHPKQDNSHVCNTCGEKVGVYPSGQQIMRQYPDVRLLCQHCIEPVDIAILAPGAGNEMFESVPKIEARLPKSRPAKTSKHD